MSAISIAIAKVRSVTAVTDVVAATKLYPIEAPQGATTPFCIFNLVAERDEQMMSGAGRLYDSRVSIECVGATGTMANHIGELVKTALESVVKETITVSVVSPSQVFTGVDIMKADTDVTDRADDRSMTRRTLDFYVRWHGAS